MYYIGSVNGEPYRYAWPGFKNRARGQSHFIVHTRIIWGFVVSSQVINAHAGTSKIIRALAQAYWGELGGQSNAGIRSVLVALNNVPFSKEQWCRFEFSGELYCTANQIAGVSGLSARWVRVCLQRLEEMGLVRWVRGMVVNGRPTASMLRICKKALVAMIPAARKSQKQLEEEQEVETAVRLARLKNKRCPSRGRGGIKTNDLQARSSFENRLALSSSPFHSMVKGERLRSHLKPIKRLFRKPDKDNREAVDLFSASANSADSSSALSPATIEDYLSKLGEVEMLPPMPPAHLDQLPDICPHGGYDPKQCDLCVDATRNKNQMEDWRRRVAQDPAYKRAEEAGVFEVSDERIIRDRATQIATEQANARAFTDRAEWIAYIITTADRLVKEYKAKGEAVLWR
nr:MAG TPA: Interferon-inducible and double-stranded-dependent eIF-2kinase dna binding protein, helix [Caudoviricetes sp.]